MKDKQLKDKAISIHGKSYVLVSDRILYFNEAYPNGSIITKILTDGERVVVQARVTPDCSKLDRYFTGISASNPTKTIEKQVPHEVAETSAVGRALAMMGIGVIDSVASVDEMNKAGVVRTPSTNVKVETDTKGLEVLCEVCGAKMVNKTGEKNGKTWSGWFCPKNTDHAPRWI